LDDLVATGDPDPEALSAVSLQARLLAGCMQQLEPAQRQAVALAYLRDQSHSEIAEALTVPLGTIKSWIRRGLAKLKTCLGGE
jgi:RNA polymerase sigma-70 factor (ECF subfamily)